MFAIKVDEKNDELVIELQPGKVARIAKMGDPAATLELDENGYILNVRVADLKNAGIKFEEVTDGAPKA